MPAPVYERYLRNVQIRTGEIGQPSTITHSIVITRTDRAVITIDTEILAIQTEGHVPYMNDPYFIPTGSPPSTPPTGMTWEQYARVRDISYQTENGCKAIVFTVTWSTYWITDWAAATVSYVLPSRTDYVARLRTTNIYRTGWSVNPSNTNASADIGGTAVSNGTQPVGQAVAQIAMRVSFIADASVNSMLTVQSFYAGFLDKLNSATFAGFAIGSVLCEGVSVTKKSDAFEFYEVTMEFLADNWWHLEQVCDSDEKGYPKLNNGTPSVVKWKRVARATADFNDLFKTGSPPTIDAPWQTRTLEGWWE